MNLVNVGPLTKKWPQRLTYDPSVRAVVKIRVRAKYRSLDFVVIRFLMKLLCTSNMVTLNACLSYFDFTLPSELLLKRYEKYLLKRGLS